MGSGAFPRLTLYVLGPAFWAKHIDCTALCAAQWIELGLVFSPCVSEIAARCVFYVRAGYYSVCMRLTRNSLPLNTLLWLHWLIENLQIWFRWCRMKHWTLEEEDQTRKWPLYLSPFPLWFILRERKNVFITPGPFVLSPPLFLDFWPFTWRFWLELRCAQA